MINKKYIIKKNISASVLYISSSNIYIQNDKGNLLNDISDQFPHTHQFFFNLLNNVLALETTGEHFFFLCVNDV